MLDKELNTEGQVTQILSDNIIIITVERGAAISDVTSFSWRK